MWLDPFTFQAWKGFSTSTLRGMDKHVGYNAGTNISKNERQGMSIEKEKSPRGLWEPNHH